MPTLTEIPVKADIVKTLVYYDVFSHPLLVEELRQHSGITPLPALAVFQAAVDEMVADGQLYPCGRFFSLHNDNSLAEKREQQNQLANTYMDKALKRARFIWKFPFVEAVYLSGSMSKGVMAPDGDVDFFIITKPGRLWIARTLLILYKKLFLLNSYKFFCVNYFIDTDHLQIEERNMFTATEVVTLVPACDNGWYAPFLEANSWVKEYYPNFEPRKVAQDVQNTRSVRKSFLQGLLNNGLGTSLDKLFLRLTLKRWQSKFGHLGQQDFDVAMKSRTYVSKHHPQNFQRRVIEAYETGMQDFEHQHQIPVSQA